MVKKLSVVLCEALLCLPLVFANSSTQLLTTLTTRSVWAVALAGIIAAVLVIIALSLKPRKDKTKALLFLGISIPVVLATIYLSYATVYLNVVSETKGPVHWHADYEVWVCGEKKTLIAAEGFSNLVGNPLLHEHEDNRIHVEGVLIEKQHANVQAFLKAVGGFMNGNQLVFPSDEGIVSVSNGETCPNGKDGELQVFVYKTDGQQFSQQKLDDPENYVLSPYSIVPPGDCIIIEFVERKEKTEHLCESYTVAILQGDLLGS